MVLAGGARLDVAIARTQGAPIVATIGATEDAASAAYSASRRHSHYFVKPS
jgi:hypothetical protein